MKIVLERLRRNPPAMMRLLFAALMVNVLGIASSLYMIHVLNRYIVYGVSSTLVTLTVGVMLAIVGEYAFRVMRLQLAAEISQNEDLRTSVGLYGLLLTAPLEALRRRPAEELDAMVRGVDQEANTLGAANMAALSDLPFVVLFVLIIALLAPPLAWVTAGVMGMLVITGWHGQKRMAQPVRQWREVNQRLAALLATALRAAESVRHFRGQGLLMERWGAVAHEAALVRHELIRLGSTMTARAQTVQAVGGVGVIAVGALMIVDGSLDVGSLIGANILANRAFAPLGRLASLAEAFKKAEATMTQAQTFARSVEAEPEIGSTPESCRGQVQLRQLTLHWPERPIPLIASLSRNIAPGSICVITGPNGSGKSTLLHLMAGLLNPTSGQILLDGIDLRQLAPGWRRRQIGFLPQEPTFLAGTLRENFLAAAGGPMSETQLRALLTRAGAGRFLAEHPAGLELMLSHDGKEVPPGIRRRLALARALIADGPLVLLDEPTVGLDREGTGVIYTLLIALAKQGKTLIIATHDENILQGAGQRIELGQQGGG
ncbi:MAG: ATP-binding cassette domain-containing protein [Magnetococcales bacterium]|nr:ATP-binding cassette domain-containing protein [Magnetococcales bacterium]